MENNSFIAVDFETATNNRFACQVGIVVVKNGIIQERISRLIQPPGNKYDDGTIRVHHITPEVTEQSPTFDKVWEEVGHYFVNTLIVAHNVPFDSSVLNINLEYYGIMALGVEPGMFWIDTYSIYGLSLRDLCMAFEMDTNKHHDALFDAECCAQFYLNHLLGISPNLELIDPTQSKSKFQRKTARQICGDVLKKDLSHADPNNPFYDRKVVITGEFTKDRKCIAQFLKEMGADIDTAITRKTNFVLIGIDPGPKKLEKLDKLIHDGFNIRKIYQHDIDAIFEGNWEGYHAEKEVKKELSLTYDHYAIHHITFENKYNIIASKELFYGKGFKGNFDLFNQITGNLGASGDTQIYPETNICVLSDSTVEKLKAGEKDETVTYIENYYNNNKSIVFDFSFISESDILNFCKDRCEWCGDEVTLDLYTKYIESTKTRFIS